MSARTEFVISNKMKEKGKLSFEDIKRIIDRSVNKTNEFINSMIERGLIEKVNSNEYILKSK
ncbi:unknown [Firmicutes bacterium CAG:460]|nr:unknown [Firmicutes bacterium CAG:460]